LPKVVLQGRGVEQLTRVNGQRGRAVGVLDQNEGRGLDVPVPRAGAGPRTQVRARASAALAAPLEGSAEEPVIEREGGLLHVVC
jgi:hypothetical protein